MYAFMSAAVPILPCNDIAATAKFYETLGFEIDNYQNYLITKFQAAEIHFWLADNPYLAANSGCYIRVSDISFFYENYNLLGIVHPQGHLSTKPWGMKEFAILDNNSNLIRFGEENNP
jgi:hypothetical protein